MNKIGINCHGANVKNEPLLIERLKKLQPKAVLVLDNLDLSRRIKQAVPNASVIFRQFEHNKNIHLEFNPEEWLDNHASHGAGGIVIHVGNEMPFDKSTLDWLLRVCKRAVAKDVTVCIGNWAVGNPQPEAWPMARELLVYANEHRKHVIVGLHEYAGGVITSGLIGGYPDNAGKPPGVPGGINLIQPESWPTDTSNVTCYHMGRYKFLLAYCKSVGIQPPRIIITEAGFDDTSDIKPWLDKLKQTPPYQNISGFRSLVNQWAVWFGNRGWSTERAYAEQMIHSDKYFYADPAIEGRCIYSYGHSSDKWIPFDTEDTLEFWDLIIRYAKEETPPVFPLTQDNRWVPAENFSGENYRIRLIAQVDDTPELGWIKVDEKFSYIGIEGNQTWLYGKSLSGLIGYVSRDVLNIVPPKEDDPPPPPPPLSKVAIQEQIAAINASITTLAKYRTKVDERAAEIEEELSVERHLSVALANSIQLQQLNLEWLKDLLDVAVLAA